MSTKKIYKKTLLIFFLIFLFISILIIWKFRGIFINNADKIATKLRKNKICPCTNKTLKLKFDDYHSKHLPSVKMQKLVKNEKVLKQEIKNGSFVPIPDGKGYKIRKLTYSEPFLHKKAYNILQELGERYQNKVYDETRQESYFEISSLTRTIEKQKLLSEESRAATKRISTHSYGVSFDIPILKSKNCKLSLSVLQGVLNDMREEGKIMLCPEKECIHVTVI